MILGPSILRSVVLIVFTAVIYPVVKVHRRSGPATEAMLPAPQRSAGRWAPGGAHGSGELRWILTCIDGSRTCLRTVIDAMVGSGVSGCPEGCVCDWRLRRVEVVETRRLELLTLSLQRRCSSS